MIYFLVQVSLIGLSKMEKLKKQDKIKKNGNERISKMSRPSIMMNITQNIQNNNCSVPRLIFFLLTT